MRCRLESTRLLRSDTANRRSTTSGPGRWSRSLEILGLLKFRRYSALSPSREAIEFIVSVVRFQVNPSQFSSACGSAQGLAATTKLSVSATHHFFKHGNRRQAWERRRLAGGCGGPLVVRTTPQNWNAQNTPARRQRSQEASLPSDQRPSRVRSCSK